MSSQDGHIRCQIAWQLDQDKKYDEVVEHVLTGCLNCITNPKKRFNGREMLFPDGPPPWIAIPDAEKSDPDTLKRFHKRQVRSEMTAEEFDQYLVDSELTDAQLAWEIAKFKRVEKLQAWSMVRDIRKKQKEKKMDEERQERDARRLQSEARREAEKVKKLDEKRKIMEKKQQKDEEKEEYLEKIKEDEKLLEEEEISDQEDVEKSEKSGKQKNPYFQEKIPEKKEFNIREMMPWSPSTYDILCSNQRSKLDHSQQKRIIAMCQSLLYHGELRHSGNKQELKDIRKVTESEYDTLVAAALEHARNETCHPLDYSTEKTTNYCMSQFRNREIYSESDTFLIKSPSFIIENVEIVSGIRSEGQGMIPKMEKVLRKPLWTSQLTLPDITKKCEVRQNFRYPPQQHKTRLLDDPVAQKLVSESPQVTVVADATTISHILTPNWESRDYEFGIAIRVKTERFDGVDKKCVVLSKPMPSSTISKATIQRKALKRALKNQFLTKTTLHKRYQKAPPGDSESQDSEFQISESSQNSESQDAPSSSSTAPSFLDSILDQMQSTDQKFSSSQQQESESIENPEDLSYQYAIFRIGDARILIRTGGAYTFHEPGEKKHSLIQNLQRITFEPRIEYLPNGGAMQMGPEEWVWNYTKAVFKASESHILYRTNYRLDNVLQLDVLTMRIDKQEPPPDALGLLSARCMMLEQVIGQLEQLEEGEYMMVQEKDRPLIVVPKCDPQTGGSVSIGAMRIKKSDCQKTTISYKDQDYFHGFCRDIPLQWQIVQGRAPQMLLAEDSPLLHMLPTKMNRDRLQREKWNVKRKLQEKEAKNAAAKRKKAIDWDDPNLYADFTNPSVSTVDMEHQEGTSSASFEQHNNKRGGASRGGGAKGGRGGRGFRGKHHHHHHNRGQFGKRGGGGRGRGRPRKDQGAPNDGDGPSTSGGGVVEIP